MADGKLVEGYLTITGGDGPPLLGTGGNTVAQDYFARKAKEDAANAGPAPASANPAPPIGLRASSKGKVIAVAPDVKFVGARGQNPTPFITRAYTDDKPEHYSPDVRYEGENAMRFNSDITKTYGGQPGTGRGIKSDTYMDRTFPKTHSNNVFINGSPAMRKDDLFHHGSSPETANTVAKAQHPGPTDAKEAPKPSVWTQLWGGARVVGGVIEGIGAVAGEVGGGALDVTGIGAVAGVPLNVGSAVVGAARSTKHRPSRGNCPRPTGRRSCSRRRKKPRKPRRPRRMGRAVSGSVVKSTRIRDRNMARIKLRRFGIKPRTKTEMCMIPTLVSNCFGISRNHGLDNGTSPWTPTHLPRARPFSRTRIQNIWPSASAAAHRLKVKLQGGRKITAAANGSIATIPGLLAKCKVLAAAKLNAQILQKGLGLNQPGRTKEKPLPSGLAMTVLAQGHY